MKRLRCRLAAALIRWLMCGLAAAGLVMQAGTASAQDLEPRSYVNTPVGMNFLIGGYGYTDGDVAFDPALPIADAHFHMNTVVAAYARSFAAWGNSAKFDVIVPYSHFTGSALAGGVLR